METLQSKPTARSGKQRLWLVAGLSFVAGISIAAYWHHLKQVEEASIARQVSSAVKSIESQQYAEGIVQIASLDLSHSPELAQLADYWRPRLYNTHDLVNDLDAFSVYSLDNKNYYVSEDGVLHPLKTDPLLAYVHNGMGDTLYLLYGKAGSWSVAIHSAKDFSRLAEHPLDGFIELGQTFLTLEDTGKVYLLAYREAQGDREPIESIWNISLEGVGPVPSMNSEGPYFASEHCDTLLVPAEDKMLLHELATDLHIGRMPYHYNTIDENNPPEKEAMMAMLKNQIERQDVILLQDQDGFSMYGASGEFIERWYDAGLSEWCGSDQPIVDVPLPQIALPELEWQTHIVENNGLDNLELMDFAARIQWAETQDWTLNPSDDSRRRQLIEALLHATDSETASMLMATPYSDFYALNHSVLVYGSSAEDLNSEFGYCSVNKQDLSQSTCRNIDVYPGNIDAQTLSSDKRLLARLYSKVGGSEMVLMDTQTLETVKQAPMPDMYIESASNVTFSADNRWLVMFDDEYLALYSNQGTELKLHTRLNIDLYQEMFDDEFPVGGSYLPQDRFKRLLITSQDQLVYREQKNKLKMRDIQTGLTLWDFDLNQSEFAGFHVALLANESHNQLALITQEGVQLVQLNTGYALTPFVYFMDLDKQNDHHDWVSALGAKFTSTGELVLTRGDRVHRLPLATATKPISIQEMNRYLSFTNKP